jgi:hypothetical protein
MEDTTDAFFFEGTSLRISMVNFGTLHLSAETKLTAYSLMWAILAEFMPFCNVCMAAQTDKTF